MPIANAGDDGRSWTKGEGPLLADSWSSREAACRRLESDDRFQQRRSASRLALIDPRRSLASLNSLPQSSRST